MILENFKRKLGHLMSVPASAQEYPWHSPRHGRSTENMVSSNNRWQGVDKW